MSSPAIRIENLSKHYRIGARQQGYRTLRESIADAVTAPFKRFVSPQPPASNHKSADFWALKDVSFEVQPGEVVGIIGRNGAGKSTLLKILSRITEPTSGRIELRGRVGSLLEVGTGFHPELTGRENIYMNGSILGMSRREIAKKFDEIVDFAEIEEFLDTPVKRYSSGMYVRLAFAVAAHLEPEILIVDEVLAVGDAEFQKKCIGKMQDVSKAGRTVLFVSHNMAAVESLCTRALVLAAGRVRFEGEPWQVIEAHIITHDPNISDVDLRPKSRIFHKVRLLNKDSTPATQFSSLEDITIELELCSPSATRNAIVGIGISDPAGTRLFTVSNAFTGQELPLRTTTQIVSCHLPRVPLIEGLYSIRLGIDCQGVCSERIEDAARFQLFGRANFLTQPTSRVHGFFCVDSDWKVR